MIHISMNNNKMGKIPSFSLLPLVTCPGKSDFCESKCYASRLCNFRQRVKINAEENTVESRGKHFVPKAIQAVESIRPVPKAFRLHVMGDFYSTSYICKWLEIVDYFGGIGSNIQFWGFTRSWRNGNFKLWLERLRDRQNVSLLASIDPTVKKLPAKGWRIAWIETDKRAGGIHCHGNCFDCGHCYRDNAEDVVLKLI